MTHISFRRKALNCGQIGTQQPVAGNSRSYHESSDIFYATIFYNYEYILQ
jgi:hypothetical protein